MKIKINKSGNRKPLININYGECFMDEYGDNVYIKTREISLVEHCCKCVNLFTGEVKNFSEMKIFKIVNSEVIVDENV